MQINALSGGGTAAVNSGDATLIDISGIDPAQATLIAPGHQFKFASETLLFFTIASVVSAAPPVQIELVSPGYNGAQPPGEFAAYIISRDYTVNLGLQELSPGDVDIRDAFTYNMRILDVEVPGGGGGPGAGAFTSSGRDSVASGAVSKTVTGSFPTPPYKVWALTNWGPVWERAGSQTTGQVVFDFMTPAPTSGAFITWGII